MKSGVERNPVRGAFWPRRFFANAFWKKRKRKRTSYSRLYPSFELLELAQEVFYEMTPAVHVLINGQRPASIGSLRDHDWLAWRLQWLCQPLNIKLPSVSHKARILALTPPE